MKSFDFPAAGRCTVVCVSEQAELYTIGEVARRVGVPTRTIRLWCDAGVLTPTDRSSSGYRRHDANAVARLDLVRTLRELGWASSTTGRRSARRCPQSAG